MKRLSILGSTGSIGVNTLDIVRQFPERFKVISLSAGLNTQLLKEQILQFRPKMVSVLNKELSVALQRELAGILSKSSMELKALFRSPPIQR